METFSDIVRTIHPAIDPAARTVGIGIVGAARIVDDKHLPAYRKHGLRVNAIYDRDRAAAERLASRHGIARIHDRLEDLLADADVDVVDCAIPNAGRREIIAATAAVRKPLLMHKPFADSCAEGEAFCRLAEAGGITLAVNQNARWAPAYRTATRLIQAGAIGEVFWIHHQLHSGFDWFNPKAWHRDLPRWQIHQYGVHHVDILSQWLGRQPSRVFAHTTRRPGQAYAGDMLSSVVCQYDGRLQAYLQETNALHPLRPWATHFEIHGTEGCIMSTNIDRIRLWNAATGTDGLHHTFTATAWFPDAFVYPMEELILAVLGGRTPSHAARGVLPTLRTIDAAYASAASGQPIVVEATP